MATRTLAQLAETYHSPSPTLRAAMLATTSPDRFGKDGAEISTARVLTDTRHLLAVAIEFWEKADRAQRRRLAGVGPGAFAVHVAEALTLEQMWARHEAGENADEGVRDTGGATRAEVREVTLVERGLAVSALRSLAGQDTDRLRAIDVATGTAETDEHLAQGVERLADLGDAWAAEPALKDLAADALVDAEWSAGLREVAATLRAVATEATRRTTTPISQAELDHQDGVVLHLLRTLVRIFDAAHRADRRIPRLTPRATYRFFHRASSSGADELVTEMVPEEELPPEPMPPATAPTDA